MRTLILTTLAVAGFAAVTAASAAPQDMNDTTYIAVARCAGVAEGLGSDAKPFKSVLGRTVRHPHARRSGHGPTTPAPKASAPPYTRAKTAAAFTNASCPEPARPTPPRADPRQRRLLSPAIARGFCMKSFR